MQKSIFELDGREVRLYREENPAILFIQPVDEHSAESTDRQFELMRDFQKPCALAAFEVADWNRDLSPWEAPPVFGKEPFGGGAEATLGFVTSRLLPELFSLLSAENTELCIGGYSLAGLFALWAATKTALFSGVAAASPSVWFPGWIDHVKEHSVLAHTVYLSLGDREARTRNPVMATVGDCINELYALLRTDRAATLEWNPGNHFQEPEKRMANAFRWVAAQNGACKE